MVGKRFRFYKKRIQQNNMESFEDHTQEEVMGEGMVVMSECGGDSEVEAEVEQEFEGE